MATAGSTDGVVVVVDGGRAETSDLLAIRNELDRAGHPLLGAVLNRETSQKAGLFGRRNRYGYYTGTGTGTGASGALPLGPGP